LRSPTAAPGFSESACAVLTSPTWVKSLGKIPQLPLALRIVFLGEQTDIIQQIEEARTRCVRPFSVA
jgi:hypothetical protein